MGKALSFLTIISVIAGYIILYSVCCQPCAIVASKTLDIIGIDNKIGLGEVEGKIYGHYYIVIGDNSYEPRFLGLYLRDNINYTPHKTFSNQELLNERGFFPDTNLILKAINKEIETYI